MLHCASINFRRLFLLGTILFGFFSSAAFAQSTETKPFTVPTMTGPVNDGAGILSPNAVRKLSAVLMQLYQSGGSQIAVLTVPSLGDASVEEAGIKVTDQWKLGKQGKDNGVLLLVAPNDRRVRIEVGKGVEGELTDAYARRIINQVIAPAFKDGDYDRGVLGGVVQIIKITDPNFDLESVGMRTRPRGQREIELSPLQSMGIVILIFVFIIFAGIYRFLQMLGIVPRSTYYRSSSWRGGGFGGFGGSGGGGGGGSWSGGGGGFSGGGSSGQW